MTHKIANVFGLAHRCPLGTRQQECPLKNVGGLPLEDRYDTIIELPSEKIHDILEFHERCSFDREDY